MYYVSSLSLSVYIIISSGSNSVLCLYCNPSFISVLLVHLTSYEQKHNQNYSNKHQLESIHGKDHSWQGQLNLPDLLSKN